MNTPTAAVRAQRSLALLFITALFVPAALHAGGQPLICSPYHIGVAKTLPRAWDFHGASRDYDRRNLASDTLALLTPDIPVIVRMETLRLAVLYATQNSNGWGRGSGSAADDRALASALLEQLRQRASAATPRLQPLAWFDLGFFAETLDRAGIASDVQGYDLVAKARDARGGDADMEFALALMTARPKSAAHIGHVAQARKGAKPETLLAVNLTTLFSHIP